MYTMLQNLSFLTDEQSRSISAENPTGEPGNGARCELDQGIARNAARDLGKGWKVNPYVFVQPHETVELANITGPGEIRQIRITPTGLWRDLIFRIYWEDQPYPSVESPIGDFFCCGWQKYL